MRENDLGELRAYAAWLRRHRLPDVARGCSQRLRKAMPWFARLSADEQAFEALQRELMAKVLDDLAHGRAYERTLAEIRRWARGANPDVPRELARPTDSIAYYACHKQVLTSFIGDYTQDVTPALALAEALERHYLRVQRMSLTYTLAVRDERHQALTAEFAREKALLESIVAHVPAAIMLVDGDAHVTWANPEAARWFGHGSASLDGECLMSLFGHEPTPRLREAVVSRQVTRSEGLCVVRAERASYWDVVYVPLTDPGVAAGSVLLLAVNVDARVDAEHAQESQIQKLEDLDRLKRAFVSSVSHELRTPLTTIMGFAELLQDQCETETYAEEIGIAARHLSTLVDDLLELAQLEAGAFKLVPRPVVLCQVVKGVVEAFRPAARRAQLRLELELPAVSVQVMADARRLEQVLANLLDNAIKFSPARNAVTVRILPADGQVDVQVEDHGVGIAEADLPRLFQRFGQLPEGERRGGTGLGLALTKLLVEAHGGQVGVLSRLGQGSTFWFRLPVGAGELDAVGEVGPAARARPTSRPAASS